MDYLTFEEYKDYGLTDIDEDSYTGALTRASMALDVATRNYYQFHDLDSDEVDFRRDKFKLAVALQMEYIAKTGIQTAEEANERSGITGQSIGRTSVTIGGRSGSGADSQYNYVSIDALNALAGTGLTYRGINYG
ncbi:hypothetical protein EQG49_11180 [Periweissella cryptocerci]|uniref:DUF4054 domain-containing protein n=1 Tax=Periweissella cryptocerci TaxID=2506420 RepID=A0A4P6YVS6_9LACO|nr:hypothetical protein [Periweissella cryptocerci]QBO36969.1 hypothetical protein EQG49_11180 [Periweissella cryptocerci]